MAGMRVSIGGVRVEGIVLQWCTRFGWIQPSARIDHAQAALNGGKVFIHCKDLPFGTDLLTKGARVSFLPYADGKGLGAESLQVEASDRSAAPPSMLDDIDLQNIDLQNMVDEDLPDASKADIGSEEPELTVPCPQGQGRGRGVQKTIHKAKKAPARGGKAKGRGNGAGKGRGKAKVPPVCKRDKTSHEGGGMGLRWACSEMQGWRPAMEDANCAIVPMPTPLEAYALFGIFDGHGGSQVSRIVADELPEMVHSCAAGLAEELELADPDAEEVLDRQTLIEKALAIALPDLDSKLRAQGEGLPCELASNLMPQLAKFQPAVQNAYSLIGSTAVVAAIETDPQTCKPVRITVANLGDSRALLCRSGVAMPLTEDHKPESILERQRIEAAGGTVALVGPCHRVDGWGLNMSRAIGDFHYKARDDLDASAQKVSAYPELVSVDTAQEDEFLLLCCDGVFELWTDQEAVDCVRKGLSTGQSLKEAVENLVDSCASVDPQAQGWKGTDNVSAMAISLREE